ncbi:MAG TPA: tetratricopeptide repeat protein [Actinomycetes bacterium]|nr:tetratricopeptide repeat protein [Actinomycetes bacterium]
MTTTDPGRPAGDVYDWYVRGLKLLDDGNPAAAAQLLEYAAAEEPEARSILEGLARARLATRQYERAREDFARLVALQPDDDYARLGLGLALSRLGDFNAAVEQLALAVAMRPDRADYEQQLRQVRATLRAREVVDAESATQNSSSDRAS